MTFKFSIKLINITWRYIWNWIKTKILLLKNSFTGKNNALSFQRFKKVDEKFYFINHFKYVSYKHDQSKKPICIFYNDETHYCAILPRIAEIYYNIIPKTILFDHLAYDYWFEIQSSKFNSDLVEQGPGSPSSKYELIDIDEHLI